MLVEFFGFLGETDDVWGRSDNTFGYEVHVVEVCEKSPYFWFSSRNFQNLVSCRFVDFRRVRPLMNKGVWLIEVDSCTHLMLILLMLMEFFQLYHRTLDNLWRILSSSDVKDRYSFEFLLSLGLRDTEFVKVHILRQKNLCAFLRLAVRKKILSLGK